MVSYEDKRRTVTTEWMVTINSSDLDDRRWMWQSRLSSSAGTALLEVAGYDWESSL
jgi:hypothetical protein